VRVAGAEIFDVVGILLPAAAFLAPRDTVLVGSSRLNLLDTYKKQCGTGFHVVMLAVKEEPNCGACSGIPKPKSVCCNTTSCQGMWIDVAANETI
jgi:hypothetical protein